MRGDRGPRGIIHRNTQRIAGQNYTGDPAGTSTPWGGGAAGASTPAMGVPPTLVSLFDDDDDRKDQVQTAQAQNNIRSARDGTKARRHNLKTIANFIAWLMSEVATLAAVAAKTFFTDGTVSAKSAKIDGVGGAVIVATPGVVSASLRCDAPTLRPGSAAGGFGFPNFALTKGDVYSDLAPLAVGAVVYNSPGNYSLNWGYGVKNITSGSAGSVVITLWNGASSLTRALALLSINAQPAFPPANPLMYSAMTAGDTLHVSLVSGVTATDFSFNFAVYGS